MNESTVGSIEVEVKNAPEVEGASLTPETVTSLMRLAVGGALLGADLVRERLRQWEVAHPPPAARPEAGSGPGDEAVESETTTDQARYALVGLMFKAYESSRRQWLQAMRAGATMGSLGLVLARPVTRNPLLAPARRRVDRLVNIGSDRLAAWVESGRAEEQRGRMMANDLFLELVRETTDFVGENEAINDLINQIVNDLIPNLADDPSIQDLIQGQSLNLANEVMDEVRERTVTADNVAERLIRALLRRTPREELPEPPDNVQSWSLPPRAGGKVPVKKVAAGEEKADSAGAGNG